MSPLDYLDMQFGFRLSKKNGQLQGSWHNMHNFTIILVHVLRCKNATKFFPVYCILISGSIRIFYNKKYSKIKPVHLPKYSKEMLKIYWYNPLVRNCSTVNLLEISLLVRKSINILQTLFKRNHVYYGIQTIYYLSN